MRLISAVAGGFVTLMLAVPAFCADASLKQNVDALISGGSRELPLAMARSSLVREGAAAAPLVSAILTGDSSVQARVNAAITLAQIAEAKVKSDDLEKGLKLAFQDAAVGVRYWGLRGLLAYYDTPPADVLKTALDPKAPRLLQMQAVSYCADNKTASMLDQLKTLAKAELGPYDAVKAKLLTREQPVGAAFPGATPPTAIDPNDPQMPLNDRQTLADKFDATAPVNDLRATCVAIETVQGQKVTFDTVLPWDLGDRAQELLAPAKAATPKAAEAKPADAKPAAEAKPAETKGTVAGK